MCCQKCQEPIPSTALLPGRTAPELRQKDSDVRETLGRTAHSGSGGQPWVRSGWQEPERFPTGVQSADSTLTSAISVRSSLDHFSEPSEHCNCPGFCDSADSETAREPEIPGAAEAACPWRTWGDERALSLINQDIDSLINQGTGE